MKLTESVLRKIIREELVKEMAAPRRMSQKEFNRGMNDYFSKLNAVPSGERQYSKQSKIPASEQDYENSRWGGTAGTEVGVWQDEDGNYWKMSEVPATEEEYESARWGGTAGSSVRRIKQ